ncbi:activated CDC42 kinase 1 isoform X2, partial [Solea senegalensis]
VLLDNFNKHLKSSFLTKVSSINSSEQQHEEEHNDVQTSDETKDAFSCEQKVQIAAFVSRASDRPGLEDNLFLPSKQSQGLSTSLSQSIEIFQELQQECMRRLNVPAAVAARSSSPSQTWASSPQTPQTQEGDQQIVLSSNEDKPQIPPRVPIPPRPIKRGDYTSARWSRDLSLSPTLADNTEDISASDQNRPPQIPPRDPLSQSGSRTPSPMGLLVGSPQQRVYSVSPTAMQVPPISCPPQHTYGSYLSTSPGKFMPTTHSFASDPKYAAPKVIQAQGKDSTSKGPCILPIVRDGRKVSNTHYYLLPERPPYLDRYDRFFREAESLPVSVLEERHVRQANTATVRPMVVNSPTVQGHAQGQGFVQPDGLTAPVVTASCTRTDGGGNSADKVKMVQEAVHGVTMEECQAALQKHNWNIQKAVHYLKVEQLFCLGLRSRLECLKLLEMCDWNLEVASTQMLDNYGSTRQRR